VIAGVEQTTQNELAKVVVYCPFGVFLQWTDGTRKLVALCPEEDWRNVMSEALSTHFRIPIEVKMP
jgi:hypothetical protein